MFDYFKPLRRKIGVCTLVIACVFAAGWVRSLYVEDNFTFLGVHCYSSRWGLSLTIENVKSGGFLKEAIGLPTMKYPFVAIPLMLVSLWLLLSKAQVPVVLIGDDFFLESNVFPD